MNVIRNAKQKIKRHIYIYLFGGRVQRQLQLRQGKCLQCGKCCKLVFRCPMLVGKTPHLRCRIYNHRSKVCMQFPISEEDLRDVNYQCGYSFRTADSVIADVDQAHPHPNPPPSMGRELFGNPDAEHRGIL